jgi:hypothetical protein
MGRAVLVQTVLDGVLVRVTTARGDGGAGIGTEVSPSPGVIAKASPSVAPPPDQLALVFGRRALIYQGRDPR